MVRRRPVLGMVIGAALAVGLMGGMASAVGAAGPKWSTSLAQALAAARKTDRAVLINFTGSDWCIWCKRLKAEVFDTPVFAKWAARNVILLEADFPSRKAQSASLKKQNKALSEKYGVKGYPTIVFISPDGTALGRSGYREGGPEAWTQNAETILGSRPKPAELTLAASLAEAVKLATENKKPLLLLTSVRRDAKRIAALKASQVFVKMANRGLVVAHIEMPLKADSADAAARTQLITRHKLPAGPTLVAVVQLGDDAKVLYKSTKIGAPAALAKAIDKVLPVPEYSGGWLEDFDTAAAIAGKLKRPMLVDFTGSDWCIWCKRLDQEIFSTDAFKTFATKRLVLVKLDFPRKKPQSDEVKQRNRQLFQRFGVRGFPTLMILGPNEKVLGKMGYMKGGPTPFLAELKQLIGAK